MWLWLMVLYINFASHAPRVKFGHARLQRLTMGHTQHHLAVEKVAYCFGQIRLELWLPCFNGEKIFFSEIFDVWYVAMANGLLH